MGEQPLNKHGACNLASINLSEFVDSPYTDKVSFDWSSFNQAVKQGIIYLDKIIDLNAPNHALPQQRENSLNFRNCGLGVFGYATMLMKMGMEYGSLEAIEFTDELFHRMFREAVKTSNELAKELGSFPKYNANLWNSKIIKIHFTDSEIKKMKPYGLRNCSLLSIAPTGTLSSLLNESGGCEPEFAISYTRRTVGLTNNQDHYYTVYCKAAREYKELYPNSELPDYFVSSSDIDPQSRVVTQAVMQDHVDTAISSTVNLPKSCTEEEMAQIYLQAWKNGLKGLTIFRNGCKREGILTTGEISKDKDQTNTPQSRGEWKKIAPDTKYYKRKIRIGCGKLNLFIGWSDSEKCVQELWVKRTGQGGCEMNIQASVIAMSGMLRLGGNIFNIEKAFEGLGACNSFVSQRAKNKELSKGTSCATAILNEIKAFLKEKEVDVNLLIKTKKEENQQPKLDNLSSKCPECGEPLVFEGGCNSCKNCGYSKCN